MSDITTVWNIAESRGDWQVSGGDLLSGDDLTTAVYISLFTDRTATDTDVIPDGSDDRRGWWGDLGQRAPIGSRLWLLSRAKLIPATAAAARQYISEALQWLIEDGVAAKISVATNIVLPRMLTATVTINRTDGTTRVVACQWAWDQLSA